MLINKSKFLNRRDAGKQIGELLSKHRNTPNTIILSLPRGGVPVAFEISKALNIPLDVLLVRKLGTPQNKELAMGAIATGGVLVLNAALINDMNITKDAINSVYTEEYAELQRREHLYRAGRAQLTLSGKSVILVDDGCATGSNMEAAIISSRELGAKYIAVAVPVSSDSAAESLKAIADEFFCNKIASEFLGVGSFYEDFTQTTDSEVIQLLAIAAQSN
jgi:predicted phosphoribosyltransferase